MYLIKFIKLPQGFVGAGFVIFGLLVALNFDPAEYKLENTLYAKTTEESVEMHMRNQEKKSEKDMALIIMLGSIGIGLLQVANAAWVLKKRESKLARTATVTQGVVKSSQFKDGLEDRYDIDSGDTDIDFDVD